MERKLQERLTGAAVLILIAVLLVPEMFTGTHTRSNQTPSAEATGAGQLKTYHVDLEADTTYAAVTHSVASLPEEVAPQSLPVVVPANEQTSSATSVISRAESAAQPSTSVSSSVAASVMQHSSAASSAHVVTTQAKKTSTSNTTKNTDKWAVQIGSFSTQKTAQEVVSKLSAKGLKATFSPIKIGGKTLYRVRSMPIADRSAAMSALKKVEPIYPGASVVPL